MAFANRLPVRRASGAWRPADGGLVAALRPALEARPSVWVGWDAGVDEAPSRVAGLDVELAPVSLSRREADGSYRGFANRALWPLLHGLVEQPVFERTWWDAYRAANGRFAAADPPAPGARWVHDYHLMLLPALLREQGARGPIGFFLHVPFPPPEVFARLPWRSSLLAGMLGADVVSFHTPGYLDNFLRACRLLLHDVRVDGSAVTLADGRTVRLGANPVSIDAAGLQQEASAPAVARHLERLRRRFGNRRVVLGVDRLDYTKGVPERLRAVELLLELEPCRRRELTFVQIAVPSRGEIHEYERLRSVVEQLVGRINGRFTEPSHDVPVHYLYRGISRDQLLAYYRLADTCLVTPLADGMNLVAKEFVTAQGAAAGAGSLILSEFAGAIEELQEALPCNPFDLEGLAGTIALSLELPDDDRRRRVEGMSATVRRHDVHRWAGLELAALGVV